VALRLEEAVTKWELAKADTWIAAQALADDGWELVAVNQSNGDDWIRFYFKREKKK
jgi:hypothetical protein